MPARTAPKRRTPTAATKPAAKSASKPAAKVANKSAAKSAGKLLVKTGTKAAAKPAATGAELARKASGAKAKLLLPFTNKLVDVRQSSIHGLGLFAATRINKGALIGVAEGRETLRNNDHVLWIEGDDGKTFGIEPLNELRYTNHSDKPNAVFFGNELFALRAIAKGDEISFDYNGEVDPDAR